MLPHLGEYNVNWLPLIVFLLRAHPAFSLPAGLPRVLNGVSSPAPSAHTVCFRATRTRRRLIYLRCAWTTQSKRRRRRRRTLPPPHWLLFSTGRCTGEAALQRCKSCNRNVSGSAPGRQKMVLDDGKFSNFRGVRVALNTAYNRVEGNRRASRNGLVSDP